ncbi:MAG: glutamate 5-kinase [Candidatus Omnitrophica bacterium]|nr:glutamate 5-kinase [Candidatus Omnitrophota bacterium]MDD5430073.1 glutamate 5-kinase [Candidatus Omnitrophota bacterium]
MMKKIVVKIGSSVIAPCGRLDRALVRAIVKDILKAEHDGAKIILVSSGAIASGLNSLGLKKKPQEIHSLMAISAFGQIILMDAFNEQFRKCERRCAQILLTWEDFDSRRRFMNIRKTIDKLLEMGIVPIVNENDVISCEEIRFGDNDRISALLADLVGAQQLIILSDVEGLLEGKDVVKEVVKIDSKIASLVKTKGKTHTSGGMATKLEAAKITSACGIRTTIAYGRKKDIISRIAGGDRIGTLFLPAEKKDKARKRWIASKMMRGVIYIDSGAGEALLYKGKSLLNVGIFRIEGLFKKGDAVRVADQEGNILGRGIVQYSYQELKTSAGKKLGKEVIHRDDFIKAGQGYC